MLYNKLFTFSERLNHFLGSWPEHLTQKGQSTKEAIVAAGPFLLVLFFLTSLSTSTLFAQNPDACSRAIPVANGYTGSFNTTGYASSNGDVVDPGWTQGTGFHHGVHNAAWFRYVGRGVPVQFSTVGSALDTEMVINSTSDGSCDIATFSHVAGTDDAAGSCCAARLTILAEKDVVYYIVIDGQGAGNVGGLSLTVTEYLLEFSPLDVVVNCSTNASFTITGVSTDGVTLGALKWQRGPAGDGPFTDIPGATSQTYVLDPVSSADNGDHFRTIYSFSIGTDNFTDIESLAALLTVNPSGVSFTATATNESTPDAEDGTITFAGLMGATNYETTIDGGMNWSMDLSYVDLAPGDYSTNVRDADTPDCAAEEAMKNVAEASLPVELISFTGRNKGAINQLFWTTASEDNNAGFDLERSSNGYDFEQIGFVPGNGTTAINTDYSFKDDNPLVGHNYYRLKQVDLDGAFEYSSIVSLEQQTSSIASLLVYPNPSNGRFTLKIQNPDAAAASVKLMDITGRLVWKQQFEVSEMGERWVKTFDLPGERGGYFMVAQIGEETLTKKVFIVGE